MNSVDQLCLDIFPEIAELFPIQELNIASEIGSYIFHEDYFIYWVIKADLSQDQVERLFTYIEYLAGNEDAELRNLGQIAIFEGLINLGFRKPRNAHLGEATKQMIPVSYTHLTLPTIA